MGVRPFAKLSRLRRCVDPPPSREAGGVGAAPPATTPRAGGRRLSLPPGHAVRYVPGYGARGATRLGAAIYRHVKTEGVAHRRTRRAAKFPTAVARYRSVFPGSAQLILTRRGGVVRISTVSRDMC